MVRFRLKELAREKGLTSEELAIQSKVKISTVRNIWQNRVGDAMYTTLAALAQTLNVSIEDLIEVVENGEVAEKNEAPGVLMPSFA